MVMERIKQNKAIFTLLRITKRGILFCWLKLCNLFSQRINRESSCVKKLNKIHQGERCFVVATGPSLTLADLELIKNEKSISMNSIINIYDETSYRPTYYLIQDGAVEKRLHKKLIELNNENIYIGIGNAPGIVGNLSALYAKRHLRGFEYYYLDLAYHAYEMYYSDEAKVLFSNDCAERVFDGYTVTYSAIQLAMYMGFTEIYLLGCDTNFAGHVGEINQGPLSNEPAFAMIEAYKVAKEYADAHNIGIVNCTRGGMLEVFPRKNLEEVLGEDINE